MFWKMAKIVFVCNYICASQSNKTTEGNIYGSFQGEQRNLHLDIGLYLVRWLTCEDAYILWGLSNDGGYVKITCNVCPPLNNAG